MGDKAVIPAITVTIKKAYEVKYTGKGKPYQNFMVSDQTGEMYLKVWADPNPQLVEGATVTFSSTMRQKGQEGVAVNVYNNNHSINCSQKAAIAVGGGQSMPQQGYQQQPEYQPEPQFVPEPSPQDFQQAQPAQPAQPAPQGGELANQYVGSFVKVYGLARQRAESANIDSDKAHEIGIAAAAAVPQHFFGRHTIDNPKS